MAEGTPNTAKPAEAPWHAAFPAPQIAASSVSREEVLQWLQEGKTDFVLVDVRRMDCEVNFPFFTPPLVFSFRLSFFLSSSHTKMSFLGRIYGFMR
jgi:hypothetical protein